MQTGRKTHSARTRLVIILICQNTDVHPRAGGLYWANNFTIGGVSLPLMKDLLDRPFDQRSHQIHGNERPDLFGICGSGTCLARNGADHLQGRGFRSGTAMRPGPRHSAMAAFTPPASVAALGSDVNPAAI